MREGDRGRRRESEGEGVRRERVDRWSPPHDVIGVEGCDVMSGQVMTA